MTPVVNDRIFGAISSFAKELDPSSTMNSDELIYHSLKGGRSAASIFRFELNDVSYVLRLFPPQINQIDALHQIALMKQAAELGIGPKVYFTNQRFNAIVMECIKGRTVYPEDFENNHLLANFAQLLRTLHDAKTSFPSAKSPFDRFRGFFNKDVHTEQLTRAKEAMEKIEAVLSLHPLTLAPAHLDLNLLNILFSDEQFYLVDWVNGGMSDPYFDLSTFAIFAGLNESQMITFLSHYFNHPPTPFEWNRFTILLPVRLFVIAAAFLSVNETPSLDEAALPPFGDLIQELAHGKANYTHHKLGSIMLKAGLSHTEQANFKKSLEALSYPYTLK
jgi:thiamine kinase-like enzyme